MKTWVKQLLALCLTVILCSGMMLSSAWAAEAEEPVLLDENAWLEAESELAEDIFLDFPEESFEEEPFELDIPEEEIPEEAALPEEITEPEILEENEVPSEEEIPEEVILEEEASEEETPEEEVFEEETFEEETFEEEIAEEETTEEETTEEETEEEETSEETAEEDLGEVTEGEGSAFLGEAVQAEETLLMEFLDANISEDDVDPLSLYSNYNGNRLSAGKKKIYNKVKTLATNIASGKATTAKISISLSSGDLSGYGWTASQLGLSSLGSYGTPSNAAKGNAVEKVIWEASMAAYWDCPYEMFWWARQISWSYHCSAVIRGSKLYLTSLTADLYFEVTRDYRSTSLIHSGFYYGTNLSKIRTINTAISNANQIVRNAYGKSDWNKLQYFSDRICALNVYNRDAANLHPQWYGSYNPWTIIDLFDGNSNTNVVCEGYAKGFQYLCDKSSFSNNVHVYCVDGDMSGAGAHMWNIVKYNGTNYLVDVTNIDSGYSLFMIRPCSGSVGKGYTFYDGYSYTSYTYSADTKLVYTSPYLSFTYNTSHVPDGFNLQDGKWKYYRGNRLLSYWNGTVKGTINGKTRWYYVKNGVYTAATGLTKHADGTGGWHYVKGGVYSQSTGMCQKITGSDRRWFYVQNGVFRQSTGMTRKITGSDKHWYFVKKGVHTKAYGICQKITGSDKRWFLVLGGVFSTGTGIAQHAGDTSSKWFYVKNGVWTKSSGMAQKAYGKDKQWYYVSKGVHTKATGITPKIAGSDKNWYYVKNGVHTKATGIAKRADRANNNSYYVQKGVYVKKTGYVTINGRRYYLVQGIVKK